MTTTVPIRKRPALYLQPIRKAKPRNGNFNQQRSAGFEKVGPFAVKEEDSIRSVGGRVLEGEDGGVKKRERG